MPLRYPLVNQTLLPVTLFTHTHFVVNLMHYALQLHCYLFYLDVVPTLPLHLVVLPPFTPTMPPPPFLPIPFTCSLFVWYLCVE